MYGLLDEVKFYDACTNTNELVWRIANFGSPSVLTSAEINAKMNTRDANDPRLTAYWTFDDDLADEVLPDFFSVSQPNN